MAATDRDILLGIAEGVRQLEAVLGGPVRLPKGLELPPGMWQMHHWWPNSPAWGVRWTTVVSPQRLSIEMATAEGIPLRRWIAPVQWVDPALFGFR